MHCFDKSYFPFLDVKQNSSSIPFDVRKPLNMLSDHHNILSCVSVHLVAVT
jgi:hypothetical protein